MPQLHADELKGIYFESASTDDAEMLTDFALKSNAIYKYRTVSDKEARKVFQVTDAHFKNGVIRLLKDSSGVIGFYGLTRWKEKNGNERNILSHLFVKPDFITKGYGTILFQEAMRVAKEELRWDALEWESDPNAAGFYDKMGAKKIGENPCPLNAKFKAPVYVYILKESL